MDVALFESVYCAFSWVIESKSTEHFSTKRADLLPTSWIGYFSSVESLRSLINDTNYFGYRQPFPLSLLCLRTLIKEHAFSRKFVSTPQQLHAEHCQKEGCGFEQNPTFSSDPATCLGKKVKIKKQHELNKIFELIRQIAECNGLVNDASIVDIGAGVGHLSRLIAAKVGLRVLAIEGSSQFTEFAINLDDVFGKQLSDMPLREVGWVTESMASRIEKFAENDAIVVGLHACGDLSSTILKIFVKCAKARHLVLVGCCYHRDFESFTFFEGDQRENEQGSEDVNGASKRQTSVFPLSEKWKDVRLSYWTRELACHNNEAKANDWDRVMKGGYALTARAVLEKYIVESSADNERNMGLRGVKGVAEMSFGEYLRKAMAAQDKDVVLRVCEHIEEVDPSVMNLKVGEMDNKSILCAELLRSMFAPLIESAIIDDRLSFLRENGCFARVLPLFDATSSPRNLTIVASKRK